MIKATKEHKELVVRILVSAFKDLEEDNSINFIVKNDENRIERMKALMGYLFEKSLLFGEVYLSQNKNACLLLSFSEKEKITLRTIFLDIQLLFKCIGIRNIFNVLKRQKLVKEFYPEENHIKPVIMGALKEAYGSGSAARLVLKVMTTYKRNKKPVVLDTVSEYNIKLYQKFGFKIIREEKTLGFPISLLRLN
ncbi:GNAT family N-acetyltransferase [uncultured Maribacter sp.]|uniref:GNAT family N-acetyltransferase n=1 Tax=uncultured Maribacter sp. TaxID=431308 RepID=UPI00263611FB|nr:GNAT family N-acetyltransferase [uncultured Maribacter sp.]